MFRFSLMKICKKTIFKTHTASGRTALFMMDGLVGSTPRFLDMETFAALIGINNVGIRAPLRAGDTI